MCTDEMKEQRDAVCLTVWRALAVWTAASEELHLLWGLSAFELDAHTVKQHLRVSLIMAAEYTGKV